MGVRRLVLPGALVLCLGSAFGCAGTGREAVRVVGAQSGAPGAVGAELSGGGAGAEPPPIELSATTSTSVVPRDPPTTARDPRLGAGNPVTIAFAGDVNFEAELADRLATDPLTVLAPISGVLSSADLTVVNLETAITERGTPAPKQFTFRAPATALDALAAAGVDVASMANNHGLDYGPEGVADTLAAEQRSGFSLIGIGADEAEAYEPYLAEVDGQRIAVIAATQVLDTSLVEAWTATAGRAGVASAKRVDRLVAAVRSARSSADTVVVFLHWGTELATCPSDTQQDLARRLVDAGADIVVGGHAHRLQGGGRLGEALVHYGLGNFAFYAGSAEGARSGVLTVTVTGRRVDGYTWAPAEIRGRVPYPLDGAAAAAALAQWEGLRACAGLAP